MPSKTSPATLALAAAAILAASSAPACTLFAAAGGAVEGGGVLVAKTRDFTVATTRQSLQAVRPERGHAYWGMFTGGKRKSFNIGLNDAGLVAAQSTAGTIPRDKRRAGRRRDA
ncbi:MAG: hypothetical protein HUK26_09225, partial [Duodenibacillus sp.]|nr:hypothetical protein [Duodenibacillus sp.]